MRTLGKDLTGESKELNLGVAPGFARQPGFPAGFLDELLGRQPMFDRNLGKQESTLRAELDKKSMMSNFDGFSGDRLHG